MELVAFFIVLVGIGGALWMSTLGGITSVCGVIILVLLSVLMIRLVVLWLQGAFTADGYKRYARIHGKTFALTRRVFSWRDFKFNDGDSRYTAVVKPETPNMSGYGSQNPHY